MISTKEEIEDTFFFFGERIPRSTSARLNSTHMSAATYRRFKTSYRLFLRFSRSWRWPFLRTAKIFGQDHLFYSPGLLLDRDMTVIEDGTANYSKEALKPHRPKAKFKNWLYGPRVNQPEFGASPLDKKIILTGIGPTPDELKEKAEVIDIKALWSAKSPEDREWILSLYGINSSKLELLKGKRAILLTQTFERCGVPEDVVVEVYRGLIKGVDPRELVIKPHPASTLDYKKYFPDAFIFEDKIPMELLTFIGVEFDDVYTVSTTAALSMSPKTRVHFAGTSVHPLILKAIGPMEYSDFVTKE
ncbi:MAG: glycosyltransferase family 52 [Rikenellaceae bacterium]